MSVDIKAIRWLLDNATAYAISKNCGVSIQAVDKYKNDVSDIMNMRLKHAISMTSYAHTLQEKQWVPSLFFLFLANKKPQAWARGKELFFVFVFILIIPCKQTN